MQLKYSFCSQKAGLSRDIFKPFFSDNSRAGKTRANDSAASQLVRNTHYLPV